MEREEATAYAGELVRTDEGIKRDGARLVEESKAIIEEGRRRARASLAKTESVPSFSN